MFFSSSIPIYHQKFQMWLYILLLWVFFIGAGILLSANLPADISDRRKLQIMEFLLRITNEYLVTLMYEPKETEV